MPNHPSIIARPSASGFQGRYVHNDGHPSMRLPLLRGLYAGPFAGDVEAMCRFLIDAHPAGWSQLGPDPVVDTGWVNGRSSAGYRDFICYCHGDRREPAHLNTEANTEPELADWIYVLRPGGIEIVQAAGDCETWLPAWTEPWIAESHAARHRRSRKES